MTRAHATLPISAILSTGTTSVEKTLLDIPGVLRVHVNPATEMTYVEYDSDRCDEHLLECALAAEGEAGDRRRLLNKLDSPRRPHE
ncbi:MAG: hypothetical protein U0163_19035 [Gemmatimonadaceae bacterium]